jgi:hypothetical protein
MKVRTNPTIGSIQMNDPERKRAWKEARAAVRAYSKDPSDSNAAYVEVAWREIRRTDGVSFWREWQAAEPTTSESRSDGARTAAGHR